MTLREEVSKILGLFIDDYGWDDAFRAADVQGKLNKKRVNDILLAICKRIDADEKATESNPPTESPKE